MSDDTLEFLSIQDGCDKGKPESSHVCEFKLPSGKPCSEPAAFIVATRLRLSLIYYCAEHVKIFRRIKNAIPCMNTIVIEPISG